MHKITKWQKTNTNSDTKPSHRGTVCDTPNLREKQEVSSGIYLFSIRKTGENIIRMSVALTIILAKRFLQTKFPGEAQDMKIKK